MEMEAARPRRRHLRELLKQCGCMREARQLQSLLLKSGLLSHPLYLRSLLSLSSSRDLSHSLSLALALPAPLSLCLPLFRALSSSIHPALALSLFAFLSSSNPNPNPNPPFLFPFLLKSCARAFALSRPPYAPFLRSGLHLHCRVLALGHLPDPYIQNSLISMYALFSDIRSARMVFDHMPLALRTVASWNSLMSAYHKTGDAASAHLLFLSMPHRNVASWNNLINAFVTRGDLRQARRVFHQMPLRDSISWNSMIAGYARANKHKAALRLFHEMQRNRVEPTHLTIVLVLNACAETGDLMLGNQIHSYLNSKNILIEGYIGNALLDMYAKCGCVQRARQLFDAMPMKHISCWNAMIVGLAVHGCSDEALELFSEMDKDQKQLPNGTTFLGVLIACRHKGLFKEGQAYFNRMIDEYKITPDIKHYGCMIDFLSRCGLVKEAYQIAKEMPIKANAVLWKTILSACRAHGHVDIAEAAFKELQEVGPLGEEELVTMSNVYAEAGRWQDVERLRGMIVDSGILKPAGWSQIDTLG